MYKLGKIKRLFGGGGICNSISLERVEIFDLFRAVACFGIVFGHLFWNDIIFRKVFSENRKYFFCFDGLWMETFFFTTGFLICLSLERCNTKQFIIKRIFRLLPVYLLSILCYCLILHKFNLKDILVNLFLIKDIVEPFDTTMTHEKMIVLTSWSLLVEVKFYALSALCFFLFKNNRHRLYSIIIINTLMFYCLKYFGIPIKTQTLGGNFRLINAILLGSICYFYIKKDILRIEFFASYLFCIVIFHDVSYFLAFIILPIIVLNFSSFGKHKIIKYLANLSYSIYLFHVLFCVFIANKFTVVNKEFSNVCIKLFFLTVCICCCHFIYYKIEKPCYDFGRRLAKRFENKK